MFCFERTLFTHNDTAIVERVRSLPKECYYLVHNNEVYDNVDDISPNKLIQIYFRLCGGKGGFGSLLRSFRIHKSTNQLMCRDLSGRRLADVKEEEKLKRWIAKKEEREKEKQRKKSEKLERLKRGPSKHEFTDQKYLQARDRILDQTEDAIEAGMRELEEKACENDENAEGVSNGSSSYSSSETSSSDIDLYDNAKFIPTSSSSLTKPSVVGTRKRKLKTESERSGLSKHLKVEFTSNVIFEYFTDKILQEVAELTHAKARKDAEKSNLKNILTKNGNEKEERKTVQFPHIELNNFNSVDELSALGIDHLKHALMERKLKCGGSLEERAVRLFSIKGLTEAEYPKKLRATK